MPHDPDRKPLLSALYQDYLESQNSTRFAVHVSRSYALGTLQRLAEHASPEVRRAAVFALGHLGDYETNHALGRALLDDDRTVRVLAATGIRNVWIRTGSVEERRRLRAIMALNSAKRFNEAAGQATELIDKAPWLAEAWNQRAIAQFALKRYADSVRDGHQALEINAYHFPAAVGMGHAYMCLDNPVSALECFRRALRLNPDLDEVRAEIDRLTRRIRDD